MATQIDEIYKCNICGNVVEMVYAGAGEIICCGEAMHLLEGKTTEEGNEKHVPVIEKIEGGYLIKVGEVPHPMTPEHYIQWIEVIADGKVYKKFLLPTDKPEAKFEIEADKIIAREYCNLHGLWKSHN